MPLKELIYCTHLLKLQNIKQKAKKTTTTQIIHHCRSLQATKRPKMATSKPPLPWAYLYIMLLDYST